MNYKPGSLSLSIFNVARFYYCGLKEAIDVEQDLFRAKMFLNLIRKNFQTKQERHLLQALLTEQQWIDLKRLVEIIKTGQIQQSVFWIEKADISITSQKKLPLKEKQIANLILKNKQPLIDALSIKSLQNITIEYDYREYGRADLFAIGDRIGFPIELKDETSNERLSGQILKYIKGAIRLIKHGHFDVVQGITVAPGYSQEGINQLKTLNVWGYMITIDGSDYSLERVV